MIEDLVNDEAILSQPCAAATVEDAPLAQDLLDTLASLEDAVCLAIMNRPAGRRRLRGRQRATHVIFGKIAVGLNLRA